MLKTLNASMSAALDRGDRALSDYRDLLERGTLEDIHADETKRGVAIRCDILKHRALNPVTEPTQAQCWYNAARLLRAGEIKPWGGR